MSSYVCNKTSFAKSLQKEGDLHSVERLSKLIESCHYIAHHATKVFKFYTLSLDNDFELDSDDHQKLYSFILYLLNNDYKPKSDEDKTLVDVLKPIVEGYISESGFLRPKLTYFQQLNTYISRTLAANLHTNVSEHFGQMVFKYVNLRLDVRNKKRRLTNQDKKLFQPKNQTS